MVEVVANATAVAMLQCASVLNQRAVHLKLAQCVSIIS